VGFLFARRFVLSNSLGYTWPMASVPGYLQPYLDAAARHGGNFPTLLWASRKTQAARFMAIVNTCPLSGKKILDVGCGRADLLQYLHDAGSHPSQYIGIEAVEDLAAVARQRPDARIIVGDFVADAQLMDVAAEVIIFSGSLNTVEPSVFYQALSAALVLARQAVVFNFLCSPALAAAEYLYWHKPADVLQFARAHCRSIGWLNDYLDGDMTIFMGK